MSPDLEEFSDPFFLLLSWQDCWVCGTSCRVAGLASDPPAANAWEKTEPILLNNIQSMPEGFLASIRQVQPHYEFRESHTAGISFFMNTCASCGASLGDHFLHGEPGGAFFPVSDEDEAAIEVHELPFVGTYRFECAPGLGTGRSILTHGKRLKFPG